MANVGGLVDVPFQNKVEFDDLARFAVKDYNQKNVNNYFNLLRSHMNHILIS